MFHPFHPVSILMPFALFGFCLVCLFGVFVCFCLLVLCLVFVSWALGTP